MRYTTQIAIDNLKHAIERVLAEITKLLHHSHARLLDSMKELQRTNDLQLVEIKGQNTKIETLGTHIKNLEGVAKGK